MFKIGQKVVCIQNTGETYGCRRAELNQIYTINGFDSRPEWRGWLELEEFHNQIFNPNHFRPMKNIGDEVESYIKSLQSVETLETV